MPWIDSLHPGLVAHMKIGSPCAGVSIYELELSSPLCIYLLECFGQPRSCNLVGVRCKVGHALLPS